MRQRMATGTATLTFVLLAAAGPAMAQASHEHHASAGGASADIKDAQGKSLGTAELVETPHGVLVSVKLDGVAPGAHALHLHAVGQCQGPDFKSAGAHFNPSSATHGYKSAKGPHAGDLPNVHVEKDGMLNAEAFAAGTTLGAGDKSLFDADGTAIVVHAKPDDYATDPAGNAGDRIACGVVEKAKM